MVIKACALALRARPDGNASFRDGLLERYSRVNVGFAVAAPGALVVPVVADADRLSLGAIAARTRELSEHVRERTVTPTELEGATFTVSNLGMYGIGWFIPVINPPQAAILGVGKIEQRPVVHDGDLKLRRRMTVTLVCDHRVIYGAEAAELLALIAKNLELPLRLLQ
jgi:pyruvate dehydrogenase E2 component (dihydrolipoamide acetyltransferase)